MILADRVAQAFHEAYEELAPSFGYETRAASAVPWDDVPRQNRDLMGAVCARLIAEGVITAATDMPVFVIKAKDLLAIEAIRGYQALCRSRELFEQADQVQLALDEILAWQRDNLGELKMPDHVRVPTP